MEELAQEVEPQGYRSIFLYVREAHPGEYYPHHTSFDEKLAHARVLRDRFQMRRTILVDDLSGTAHRAYGTLPNMTYIINRAGAITLRCDWTDAETVSFAVQYQMRMTALRREGARLRPFYVELQGLRWNDPRRFEEGLAFNGPKAVTEFAETIARWEREGSRSPAAAPAPAGE